MIKRHCVLCLQEFTVVSGVRRTMSKHLRILQETCINRDLLCIFLWRTIVTLSYVDMIRSSNHYCVRKSYISNTCFVSAVMGYTNYIDLDLHPDMTRKNRRAQHNRRTRCEVYFYNLISSSYLHMQVHHVFLHVNTWLYNRRSIISHLSQLASFLQ